MQTQTTFQKPTLGKMKTFCMAVFAFLLYCFEGVIPVGPGYGLALGYAEMTPMCPLLTWKHMYSAASKIIDFSSYSLSSVLSVVFI